MPVFDEHFDTIFRVYNTVSGTLFYFIKFITINCPFWGIFFVIVICCYERNGNEQMETIAKLSFAALGPLHCARHYLVWQLQPDHYSG